MKNYHIQFTEFTKIYFIDFVRVTKTTQHSQKLQEQIIDHIIYQKAPHYKTVMRISIERERESLQ